MKAETKKYIFISLVIATGIFDFCTFYFGRLLHFEINPIFVVTQSVLLLFALKVLVISGLAYMVFSKRNKTYFSSYAFILVGLYLIIAQFAGGISNINITYEQPAPEQALAPSQAVETFAYLSLLWIYYPLLMALLGFKLWEWVYIKKGEEFLIDGIRNGNNKEKAKKNL